MNELRDKCKKAADITVLLLHMIVAFVGGYCIAKERGDAFYENFKSEIEICKELL